jgi:membrane protein
VFGAKAANGTIQVELEGMLGSTGAQVIEDMMVSASKPKETLLATLIGAAISLFAASGVFAELQTSLNIIWKAPPSTRGGVLTLLRERFLSFTMVLGIGFLLLVSLVLSAGLAALGSYLKGVFPGWELTLHAVTFVISFGVVTLLFAMIYKVLPNIPVAWSDVWLGAAVTSFLFSVGKLVIGLYLGKSSVTSAYGAAGSIAVVLIWVYYSAQILLVGAEFTQVFARMRGSKEDEGHKGLPVPLPQENPQPTAKEVRAAKS